MNKTILVGRLTKDPAFKTTGTGRSVCSFTVAVDRPFKKEGQPTADFIPVVAWGRQAEIISQYMTKGRQIALCGRMQVRHYDAQDGSKRYVTEVILEEFSFIGSNASRAGSSSNSGPEPVDPSSGSSDFEITEEDFKIALEDDADVPF